jgi:hypothetical protein
VGVISIGIAILLRAADVNPYAREDVVVYSLVPGILKRLSLKGSSPSTLPGSCTLCSTAATSITTFALIELEGSVVDPTGTIAGNVVLFVENTIVLLSENFMLLSIPLSSGSDDLISLGYASWNWSLSLMMRLTVFLRNLVDIVSL